MENSGNHFCQIACNARPRQMETGETGAETLFGEQNKKTGTFQWMESLFFTYNKYKEDKDKEKYILTQRWMWTDGQFSARGGVMGK